MLLVSWIVSFVVAIQVLLFTNRDVRLVFRNGINHVIDTIEKMDEIAFIDDASINSTEKENSSLPIEELISQVIDSKLEAKMESRVWVEPKIDVNGEVNLELESKFNVWIGKLLATKVYSISVLWIGLASIIFKLVLVYTLRSCKGRPRKSDGNLFQLRKSSAEEKEESNYIRKCKRVGFVEDNSVGTEMNKLSFPRPKEFNPNILCFKDWITLFESYAYSFPKAQWKCLLLNLTSTDVLKRVKNNDLDRMDYQMVKDLIGNLDKN